MIEIFLIQNMAAYVLTEKISAMWISVSGASLAYTVQIDGGIFTLRDKAEYDRVLFIFKLAHSYSK